MAITATEKALGEVRRQSQKRAAEKGQAPLALRIGMRGGGCTGFSYMFEWADKPAGPKDHVIELGEGVTLFVDPKSYLYLDGTELDFVTSMMGYGFKFNNPNVKSTCGCGESVQF